MKNVHFIAIGGSIMHSLAIALSKDGYRVSGSDDQIFEPSKSRLQANNILPKSEGWDVNRITTDLDAVILGMHAKKDNPELLKAQELSIKTYSFPEFLFEVAKNKQRIVIAGSHGKTSITAMIIHVLNKVGRDFDFVVGSSLEGIENSVKLSDAPVIILEGDEYLSSPLDNSPKFMHYDHHIVVISGIAWDHINVFPSKEIYNQQFEKLIDGTKRSGKVIFNEDDLLLSSFCHKEILDVEFIPYSFHKYKISEGKTVLNTSNDGAVEIDIFGEHNLYNLNAAKLICNQLAVNDTNFYNAIKGFSGAKNRLEILMESETVNCYKDFAHAPSKLKATVNAVKNQFPKRELTACIELHTFNSLNKEFIAEYFETFENADSKMVYINPETFSKKSLPEFTEQQIKEAFGDNSVVYYTDAKKMRQALINENWEQRNLLLMSSGDFDGMNIQELVTDLKTQ